MELFAWCNAELQNVFLVLSLVSGKIGMIRLCSLLFSLSWGSAVRYMCLASAVPLAKREQERVEPCSVGALLS